MRASDENIVHVETGAEYGFVVGAGYTRVIPAGRTAVLIGGDYTMPYAHFDFSDFRVRAHVTVPMLRRKGWTLAGRVAPLLRTTKNEVNRTTSVGSEFSIFGGYYHSRWFLPGIFGVDWAMTSHIKHSDGYREAKYAGAKDGWYRSPGASLHYGVMTGVSFKHIDLVLRVGQTIGINGSSHQLPVYGMLGVNFRFGKGGWRPRSTKTEVDTPET